VVATELQRARAREGKKEADEWALLNLKFKSNPKLLQIWFYPNTTIQASRIWNKLPWDMVCAQEQTLSLELLQIRKGIWTKNQGIKRCWIPFKFWLSYWEFKNDSDLAHNSLITPSSI
jgi:hypothetical protein